jgi:hypothetical protein
MIGAISDENAQRSTRLRKATARQAFKRPTSNSEEMN